MSAREMSKAIVGGLIAGLSVLAGAAGDGISIQEWITTAVAFLSGLGIVYVTPNRAPASQAAKPDVSEQDGRDRGAVDVVTILVVVLVVLVVLLLVGRL
jgi:hypothetical protein